MVQSSTKHCKVFLSSFYTEHAELRSNIFDIGQGEIWVAEKSRPELGNSLLPPWNDPLVVVDNLIDALAQSESVFVILGPSRTENEHGALIDIGNRASSVSYFEIELFQAAMLGKPVEVFIADNFEPGPRLKSVLQILQDTFPREKWRNPQSDKEIENEIRGLLTAKVQRPITPLPNLVHSLYQRRTDDILFLDSQFDCRSQYPQKDLIEELLLTPTFNKLTVNKAGQYVNTERRLARVWIAVRELMAAPYPESKYSDFLPLWNKALGQWFGNSAWYGLHGYIYLGCLAAINSWHLVREHLQNSPLRKNLPLEEIQIPWGPRASALYSIAKLLPKNEQRKVLRKALFSVNNAIKCDQRKDSDLKAVRGSIHLRLLNPIRAIRDYKKVLKLREQKHESDERIGDAMAELGFAYVCIHRFQKGLELLEEGVKLLGPSQNSGFLIRAKRKLAEAYRRRRRLDDALRQEGEAMELAEKERMLDQKRQISESFVRQPF